MADVLKSAWEANPDFNAQYDEINETLTVVQTNCEHLSPSEALFSLDPVQYEQAIADWKDKKLSAALGKGFILDEIHERNRRRFNEVLRITRRGRLIPFIGAGLSKACGCPTWHEYLRMLAERSKDRIRILAMIELNQLDDAADALLRSLEPALFNELSDTVFGQRDEIAGAIKYLPQISKSCVLTSNFDMVVEDTYKEANEAFDRIVIGNVSSDFHRALASGERQLLKIHGQIRDTQSRVFCKSEYMRAYGENDFDFSRPLPDILGRVYRNYCLLFVGCGLNNDKTLSLFRHIKERDGEERLPRHYAIVEAPNSLATDTDKAALEERENYLCQHQIFPIWYQKNQHQFVTDILECLADEFYQ
jgi:hypothetical protein